MIEPRVLFQCSENSCRTPTAEAFLRDMAGGRFEVMSALDPEAVAAMDGVGLDISRQTPKNIVRFQRERVTFLVTLGNRAMERARPIFPGAIWRLQWPVENQLPREAATNATR